MIHKFFIGLLSILICIVFFNLTVNAQKLIGSRKTSYLTYIYKLTDKEAEQIYKKDLWVVDSSFFHTLVKTFPTDSVYSENLPGGHYLKTYSENNKQQIQIATVQDFDVKILDNTTDLCVQVYNSKGDIVPDAEVFIRKKKLRYDDITHSYVDKKSNKKGLLKVRCKEYTAFYKLKRKYNNGYLKRASLKILYRTPLKYVWIPVRFVIHIPIDGIRSIVKGRTEGSIFWTKRFFVGAFNKVACLIDNDLCDKNKFQGKHRGYLVFNKPKYLPKDTVKFKAFIVTRKGKRIHKEVKVILEKSYGKTVNLGKLKPYRKGGYAYQFCLHDSLNLELDRDYTIRLELKNNKKYVSSSFKYEDYELAKNSLELRADAENHYRKKPFKLYVRGTDENNLNLLDARIELLVKFKEIHHCFDNKGFVPDTLYSLNKQLEPRGETEITIPDSVFAQVNLSYEAVVRLLTSDNEVISKDKKIEFFHYKPEFNIKLENDSILFTYTENGKSKEKKSKISTKDPLGNKTELLSTKTPCKIKINPYYDEYIIQADSLAEGMVISQEPSLVKCISNRTKDSLFIEIDNPRKIPFSYYLYKRNNEIAKGYTDSLRINAKANTRQKYFVSIQYLWGGKITNENYNIPFLDKTLNIVVSQPKIIYPGQKSNIEITVTDQEKKPVPGVDMTAYALTKKFNYMAPEMPYLGKRRRNKITINNFSTENFSLSNHTSLNLDYKEWKLLAGLDSIEYYKFIYPENIYRFEYASKDSITQFAPFVTDKGNIEPIHIIYVDSKPKYFSWSTHTQPYSFKIDSGYHQVKLRTRYHEITIDSLYFKPGKKLIFSINNDLNQKNVHIQNADPALSGYEKRLLYHYIFPYKYTFGERYAYLEQNNEIQFLKPGNYYHKSTYFAGPIVGNTSFHLLDSFSTNFYHEPFFEYEFAPQLLKMRSIDSKSWFPSYLEHSNESESLSDLMITKEKLKRQWGDFVDSKRYMNAVYLYRSSSTSNGKGKLQLNYSKDTYSKDNTPLNILVFRYDTPLFIRVYPGNTSIIHELDKGYHKLVFFFPGAKYFIVDSVNIHPNGLNYHEIQRSKVYTKDSFSTHISKLIEETIFNGSNRNQEKELRQFYNMYQQGFNYSGAGRIIEGHVYSKNSQDTLAGAVIYVKGTSYATVTDLNGYYSIKVPEHEKVLVASYLGYKDVDIYIGQDNYINIKLEEDASSEEVVVVGYGTIKKSDLTGSVSSIMGKISGVDITRGGEPGQSYVYGITIRGNRSLSASAEPIYIVDGVQYSSLADINPHDIGSMEVLKDASSTAIYGARGANGVVIITTKGNSANPTATGNTKGAEYDNTFLEAASKSNSIRANFSDYAFWQPKLITDKDGKANFEITFPDDVTSWKAFYLGMNGKRQSGQSEGVINSYKPLMAQLSVPRFLIQSDTTYVIGKVLNYTTDSIKMTTNFMLNDKPSYSRNKIVIHSTLDTLAVIAKTDSLSVKYFLEKEDGYYDGELKKHSRLSYRLEETKGDFYVLDKDTTFHLKFDSTLGDVNIYARADVADVIIDETNHIINYKYLCNEQIASKLKALLAKRTIFKYKGLEFKEDKSIKKLIGVLEKNKKDLGLWGWWGVSETSYWISTHVIEAIVQAKQSGFIVKIDESQLIERLVWELENSRNSYEGLRMIKALKLLHAQVDYKKYINGIEKKEKLSFNQLLQVIELKQLCKLPCKTDTLINYRKETLFGNIYFADKVKNDGLLVNDNQNTILAYRILKKDSLTNPATLNKIRNYFLEKRQNGYWMNTYESAQIIEILLHDSSYYKTKPEKPVLKISGDLNKTFSDFPLELKLNSGQHFTVSKTGKFPVYFTSHQKFWNQNPDFKSNDFEITTSFNNDKKLSILKAGKETKLIAKVKILKDAEYVMINIPIPGGFSYGEKKNNYDNEVHREHFKNETAIFCQYLKKGEYTFEVNLIPRYNGRYTLNPAKIELMYFPTFNANDRLKKITVK